MHAASKSPPEASPAAAPVPVDPAATPLKRGLLWAAVALAVACGLVWGLTSLPDARERLAAVPLNGTGFSGQDVGLTEMEQNALARANVLHRHYTFGGRSFYVTAIDGTRDRHIVHDPRYCFQGAGWRVLAEREVSLPGGSGTWLRAREGENEAQAVFWFFDGRTRYSSPLKYWWQTTLRRLTVGRSGPEPVMVMMQSVEIAEEDWPGVALAATSALGL
jgi:hypothetical protein